MCFAAASLLPSRACSPAASDLCRSPRAHRRIRPSRSAWSSPFHRAARSTSWRGRSDRSSRRPGASPSSSTTGPALQALLAGDTQLMFDNLANSTPQLKAGKLKALAVTTAKRSALAPELPTLAETGLPGFDIYTWWGFMAPAGTPKDIIAKWNAEVTRILATPEMKAFFAQQGAEPAPTTPEQF